MSNINYYVNKKLIFHQEVYDHIKWISEWDGVKEVSIFPDIHPKAKEIIPTGVVFSTEGLIYPIAIKSNFCGMSIFRTSLQSNNMPEEKIDLLYSELEKAFNNRKHRYWDITSRDLDDILFRGVDWIKDKFGLEENDQNNLEKRGTFFGDTDFTLNEVKKNIPKDVYKGGLKKLGLMWVGNHFLEMNNVIKVCNEKKAKSLGLNHGQIVFMMHGEPGALGSRIGKYFLSIDKLNFRNKLKKGLYHFSLNPFTLLERNELYFKKHTKPVPIKADSKEGRRYISCAYAAMNYAIVNRTLIYKLVKDIIKKNIDPNVETQIMIDVAHKSIREEDVNGKKIWVHRNGANRAMGPGFSKGHPLFSLTGQVLPLPGSMVTGSYICVAEDNVSKSVFSVNHGTGRRLEEKQVSNEDVLNMLNNERIYIKKMGGGEVKKYSPTRYKDLDEVMETIRGFQLVDPVVKIKPIGVLKG